MRIQSIV
jgi:hypothetical protein